LSRQFASYGECELGRVFSRYAVPTGNLGSIGNVATIHHYMPASPHFASGVPKAHVPPPKTSFSQYFDPIYQIMLVQQHQLQEQQRSQKVQQSEIFDAQNKLIRDMFSGFENAFKAMMDAMVQMNSGNHNNAQVQNPVNNHAAAEPLPEFVQPPLKTANSPIQVKVDPISKKITRISEEN
jgi:hypothetical protein